MRLLILSDTHLEFPLLESIPNADILIHVGDWTNLGYRHSKAEFVLLENFLSKAREKVPIVLALVVMFTKRLEKPFCVVRELLTPLDVGFARALAYWYFE
jgi:3',5'-cyclic AMP phosphodiesterase CpdA